jgi:hypothetical protein
VVAREQPAFVSFTMIRGSTTSVDAVPSARNISSLMSRRNFHRLMPAKNQEIAARTPMNSTAAR